MTASDEFDRMILEFMNDDPLTVYYLKHQSGSYNTSTGEFIDTTVEIAVKAIIMDMTSTYAGLSRVSGKTIMSGDKELYVFPPEKNDTLSLPLTIDTNGDKVRVGGVVYSIEGMKEVNPNVEAPLLYCFHIRR